MADGIRQNVAAAAEAIRPWLTPVTTLRRSAMNRGLLGGSGAWTALFITLVLARRMRRVVGRSDEVVSIEKLQPGETVVLRAIAPLTRAEKKAGVQR